MTGGPFFVEFALRGRRKEKRAQKDAALKRRRYNGKRKADRATSRGMTAWDRGRDGALGFAEF
jgi:hypothetical protein